MAEDERQIRAVAETLLSGSINSQRSSYTQQSITRTPDIILSENLIAGAMQDGRMSNVRRFFCLFVTFDLLLTFLMWLICTMIAGESLKSAFINQVLHYHITTSLFDIVMAAIFRFTVLLLFYAMLHIDHWIIVASTTASTCAFLIAKVFLFDWSTTNQPVFQVLLILASFVLPWVEAWFFDIRVLPQETHARNWIRNFAENEREPLLRGTTSESHQYRSTEPGGTFFTPIDSSDQSDNEEDISTRADNSRGVSKATEVFPSASVVKLTPEMIEDYKRRASALVQDCHKLLKSKAWQAKYTTEAGDLICYMNCPKSEGTVLKVAGIIKAPADILINKLFDEIESLPSWNKLVTESRILQYIDKDTDIIYQITDAQGGGIIGARDFVILRHRIQYGNYYINTGTSVSFTTLPTRRNVIRAENNISCFAAERIPNEENKCKFTWIISTNLKGWLPQKIVDKSMYTTLSLFMSYGTMYVSLPRFCAVNKLFLHVPINDDPFSLLLQSIKLVQRELAL